MCNLFRCLLKKQAPDNGIFWGRCNSRGKLRERNHPGVDTAYEKKASELSRKENSFYADQFGSPDVTKGYEPMGNEISMQLGDKIDILCASVGTGGALMGAWKGLRKAVPKIELVAFEPLQSPLLTTGKGGAHQVEGVGVGF